MNELRLDNFLGIDFGSSPEDAKKILLSKTGCVFNNENSSDEVLFFNGLTFAGHDTSSIMLLFINKKFYKSTVQIKPKHNSFAIKNYKEIQNEFNSKYFFVKNDVCTKTGISLGKEILSSYWILPNINGVSQDLISLKIYKDYTITINYEYGELSNSCQIDQDTTNAITTCFFLISFMLLLYVFVM